MAELGPTAPEYHKAVGELIRSLGIDVVLSVGELARDYGGEHAGDAAEAAAKVTELVQPGDVVLVKGSRALGLEVVAEALTGVPA
jgi:UDP-N-acetylmuramoyl-tripeptide--D-alanyl-D-alanine ligase